MEQAQYRIGFIPYLVRDGEFISMGDSPEGALQRVHEWYRERLLGEENENDYFEIISVDFGTPEQFDEPQIFVSFRKKVQIDDEGEFRALAKAYIIDPDDDGNYPIGYNGGEGGGGGEGGLYLVTGDDIAYVDQNGDPGQFW
jgi:hypothetical protein